MKTLYVCEICEGKHETAEDALNCEAKGSNPLYEIDQKVMHLSAIVKITKREICTFTHSFIYMFHMSPEDNPGKMLYGCGWKNEKELQSLPIQA